MIYKGFCIAFYKDSGKDPKYTDKLGYGPLVTDFINIYYYRYVFKGKKNALGAFFIHVFMCI